MRFSNLTTAAIKKASKGKDASKEIEAVVAVITKAVVAYTGNEKAAKKAFARNKNQNTETVRGCMPLATLDDASLVTLIKTQHLNIVADTCQTQADENFALNAELARGIATNPVILGACFHLGEVSEGNDFL